MKRSARKHRRILVLIIAFVFAVATNCTRTPPQEITTQNSAYPFAVDVKKVGSYPALTKSGAGYFYDDVLEYRVWINPAEGGGR